MNACDTVRAEITDNDEGPRLFLFSSLDGEDGVHRAPPTCGRRGRSYKETAELFSIFGFSRRRPSSLVGRRSRFWVVGLLGRCAGLPALPKGLWRQYGPWQG